MTPGTYLRKRRERAGLGLPEVARQIAWMQLGLVQHLRGVILDELCAAEADQVPLAGGQLILLRNVVPMDSQVYLQLADIAVADPSVRDELPLPQLCRECACSWSDPCHPATGTPAAFRTGPCHWVLEHGEAGSAGPLCSACAAAATAPDPGLQAMVAREPA